MTLKVCRLAQLVDGMLLFHFQLLNLFQFVLSPKTFDEKYTNSNDLISKKIEQICPDYDTKIPELQEILSCKGKRIEV